MDKKRKEEILERLKQANSEDYETSWNEKGIPISKSKKKIEKGKKSRSTGGTFELRVRKDLETKGFIVDKWSNNLDLEKGELIPAKRKFNPYSKVMTIGTGFPDFIAFKKTGEKSYNIMGVEVKTNATLSRIEKLKCRFLLEKDIFNDIWLASKEKEGRKIVIKYEDIKEKYKRVFEK
jgi:hypothetical protein